MIFTSFKSFHEKKERKRKEKRLSAKHACYAFGSDSDYDTSRGGILMCVFVDAFSHLCKRVYPSVRRSVGPSVRRSVTNELNF